MLLGYPLSDLVERDVLVLRHQFQNERLVGIELRATWLTLTAGSKIAGRPPLPIPRPSRRDSDREPTRRCPRRQTVLDRLNHPLPQIQTERTRHICLPIATGIQNHVSSKLGIPRDSNFTKDALVDRI